MEQVNENVVSDKLLDKLAKIKRHEESAKAIGNEQEAQHFARMLSALMTKHQLEMSDLEWEKEIEEEPVDSYSVGGGTIWRDGKRFYKEYPDVEVKQKRQDWSERLARIIAGPHSCRMIVHPKSSKISFVGRKSNVMIAEYMYISMYRVLENLSWKEYKTARNKTKWEQIKHYPKEMQSSVKVDYSELEGYRQGWIDGFLNGLQKLFREMEEQRAADPNACTAMVHISKDKAAIQQWYDQNTRPAGSLGGSNRGNDRGYSDGGKKAKEVGLTAKGMGKGVANKELK